MDMKKFINSKGQVDYVCTSRETSKILRKTLGTLANWRVIGKGPKFIPGNPTTYLLSEINKHLARELKSSTSQK